MMDLFKNKYLWSPFLIFSLVFLLDKIAFIPVVKKHLVAYNKIEPLLYESREELFQQLITRDYPTRTKLNGEKLGLILGTSRSSEFDPPIIAQTVPNSYTYNFSAPFASPVYYYYWLYKLQKAGIKPDFVLVEADAAVFTSHAIDYQLAYSLDNEFVWKHIDLDRPRLKDRWQQVGRGLSITNAETYFLKQLFGFYKFPLKVQNIQKNLQEQVFVDFQGNLEMIQRSQYQDKFLPFIQKVNSIKLGGIPNTHGVQPLTGERMRKDTRTTVNRDLLGFKPDPTQVIFFRNLMTELARLNIPAIVYVPVVSDTLRQYKKDNAEKLKLEERFYKPFYRLIQNIINNHKKANIKILDLNEDARMDCRKFQDAYHLGGECFPRLSQLLFSSLPVELLQ